MSIVYVGLDLGSSNFQQVALNHDGVSRVNRDFATSEANLVKAFSDLKGEKHVHLEAGELAPWAASVIAPLVTRVVCSHPQSNAWIAKDADLFGCGAHGIEGAMAIFAFRYSSRKFAIPLEISRNDPIPDEHVILTRIDIPPPKLAVDD